MVVGEFTVLIFKNNHAVTLNPGGTVRNGAPVLDEAAKLLKAAGIKEALIVGELYIARKDNKRARVHDVVKVARKPTSDAELDSIRFAVFDLLEVGSRARWNWRMPFRG